MKGHCKNENCQVSEKTAKAITGEGLKKGLCKGCRQAGK